MVSLQSEELTPFPCTRCGGCCRRVGLAPETRFLDRGDGACLHYDAVGKTCLIYENRPDICRTEAYFKEHYQQVMPWDRFVKLNLEVCQKLEALDASHADSDE